MDSSVHNAWIPRASQGATTDSSKVASLAASSGPILGIDLGTTNSCMAIWHPGKNRAKIIKNIAERRLTPSTVAFGESFADVIVGSSALESTRPVVTGVKAVLGFAGAGSDAHTAVVRDSLPPDATIDKDGRVLLTCEDAQGRTRTFSPEEISTQILKYLKSCAETYLARKPVKDLPEGFALPVAKAGAKSAKLDINRVVIGIPVCFTESQREATRNAAAAAGFREIHLMIESSAAAMAYGLLTAGSKTILVFDIGGGTTDVTVMEVHEGSYSIAATGGQGQCGGERMDALLLELILSKIADAASLGEAARTALMSRSRGNRLEHGRLLGMARKGKEALTQSESVTATLPIDITSILLQGTARDLASVSKSSTTLSSCTVTRKEFEAAIKPLCSLVKEIVSSVVTEYYRKAEALSKEETKIAGGSSSSSGMAGRRDRQKQPSIDEIILVGGTSNVPVIRKMVRQALTDCGVHWYREASGVSSSLSASSAFPGNGAASSSSASALQSKHRGVSRHDTQHNPERETSVEGEFCCSIDPHEAVAQGLAIRGGVLMGVDQGKLKDILMLDVTPKSLGVLSFEIDPKTSLSRHFFEPVLHKSTRLPARGVCKFRLEDTKQRFVTIEVYEELDELILRSAVTDDMVTNCSEVLIDAGNEYVIKYEYRLMCSYDFPVADFPVVSVGPGSGETARFAFVEITMSEEGDTAVRVLKSPDETAAREEEPKELTSGMWMLVGYLVALLLLYCVVKALLPMHNYPMLPPEGGAENQTAVFEAEAGAAEKGEL